MMKLTIVMSVRNQAGSLEPAVNSILKQTFKDFQLIIVDDASTDETEEILTSLTGKDKRIKVINNRYQLGLTKSLNKALKEAKTQYVARMDGDDISLPQRLEEQVNFLDRHPQVGILGTAVHLINDQGKQIGLKRHPLDHKTIYKAILSYCPFIHPTLMFRRSALLTIGDYNQEFLFAQDYEIALRMLSQFKGANLPQPLLDYRVDSRLAISMEHLKEQEWLALKARFLALRHYGYPVIDTWRLIKPLLSFLLPSFIKKIIYRRFFWR